MSGCSGGPDAIINPPLTVITKTANPDGTCTVILSDSRSIGLHTIETFQLSAAVPNRCDYQVGQVFTLAPK